MSTERKLLRVVKPHSSLAAWRNAHGLDQREAAQKLGISQSYYSKLETHNAAPRPKLLKQVAERTGVPLDELMGIAS